MNAPELPRQILFAAGQAVRDPEIPDASVVVEMLSEPGGLDIRDRMYRLRRYRSCFTGKELIAFLMHRLSLSRETSMELARQMESLDYIRHVCGEHTVADDASLFYCLGNGPVQDAEPEHHAQSWDLASVVQAMRAQGGLKAGVRYRFFVRYPNCFSGKEAVDWLMQHCSLARPEAVELGETLLRKNFIRHLFDEHGFEDATLLYHFV